MEDAELRRTEMVERQIASRGIRDERLLAAMKSVPRDAFLPPWLEEFAYDDTPLSIGEGQTISQPYIVAAMIAAAHPRPNDRVLEIGTGSGYAAAILAKLAREVDTVERHEVLATLARERLHALGFRNVRVHLSDGTLGWRAGAPYDVIIVSAGGPLIPPELVRQLAVGGRMVIPVGDDIERQRLVLVRQKDPGRFVEEALEEVRFVPLVGEAGWEGPGVVAAAPQTRHRDRSLVADLVRERCEPFNDVDAAPMDAMLDRIGKARVVLLGECTHGTSEFYRMRARITKELIQHQGFTIVAIEGDWPDAATLDRRIRGVSDGLPGGEVPFSRFPTWMWRNVEFGEFADWMRAWNAQVHDPSQQVRFHGLDLYSLHTSIAEVLRYLDDVDAESAGVARARYGCLTPWARDPAQYGRMALTNKYRSCEEHVAKALSDLLERRLQYESQNNERYFDAAQNARLVKDAERYYRAMYYGAAESWNLRDRHMFDTLLNLLDHYGSDARAVVWAHNSHVGNASATDMGRRGEINIGELCRKRLGSRAYLVGFGTDHGTVAAADDWDEPMQIKSVRGAHPDSYERVFHESEVPAFCLPLGAAGDRDILEELHVPRLERAIGVIYRPDTERQSHYFDAVLPEQFDEYVWIDETTAVRATAVRVQRGEDELFPFGV